MCPESESEIKQLIGEGGSKMAIMSIAAQLLGLCCIALLAAQSSAFSPVPQVVPGSRGSQWHNRLVQASGTHSASGSDVSSRRSMITRTLMVWSTVMACTVLNHENLLIHPKRMNLLLAVVYVCQ
jgi:hypothetical protein